MYFNPDDASNSNKFINIFLQNIHNLYLKFVNEKCRFIIKTYIKNLVDKESICHYFCYSRVILNKLFN